MTNDGARAAPDNFDRAAAHLAVAQLCDAARFHGATALALNAFADVVVHYLLDLGRTAEFHANRVDRTEIINFVKSAPDKIPFAQLISNFSVVQERCRIIPSFDHMGEAPPKKHIPTWLST
ncbi:hypothetical protein GYH30_030039 [Glycine max]|uniref:Bromodomain associated domain-containing protein n=1 Tax=Glycine max TaxID=3847 RepID=A0A0R0HCS6_SOYBN|nr:hypothetical protein GYH30_030039 [Glycine max]